MKTKKTLITLTLLVSIGLYAQPITIETVHVGNAGNAGDTRTTEEGGTFGAGAVSYDYRIGTTGVTAGQYTAFLNAVASDTGAASYITSLYNTSMSLNANGCGITRTDNGDGTYTYTAGKGDNMPVNYVNVYDAMRFCNWLTTGNTEVGVYMLNGSNIFVTRNTAAWENGGVAIASLDEWYKAAFYQGNIGLYSTYFNGKEVITTAEANFNNIVGTIADVRKYEGITASFYGVLDISGNVWEWTDTPAETEGYAYRRGGAFNNNDGILAAFSNYTSPVEIEHPYYGFRVVSLQPIPEPGTYAAIFGALALAVAVYRRRK